MKVSYEMGDRVSLLYLNEEGIVIQVLGNEQYRVAVGGEVITIHEVYLEPIYSLESAKNRIERLKRRLSQLEEELDYMYDVYDNLKKA